MRIFPDANVFVAAFIWETGICAQILEALLVEERHVLILGDWVWEETVATLYHDFGVPTTQLAGYKARLTRGAHTQRQPTPLALSPYPVTDPDDRVVLSCALVAYADALVTGDKALLQVALQVYESERLLILTPAAFWQRKGELW